MKRAIAVIVLGFSIAIGIKSCTMENSQKVDDSSANSRIKMKERRIISGYAYNIIAVDDTTEFLVLEGHSVIRIK